MRDLVYSETADLLETGERSKGSKPGINTTAYTARTYLQLPLWQRAHWTYFMQILSNYNTKSLYHIENSVIKALKSDIFHSYTCEINIGDIWLQFEKLKKLRQMALSYRNIKNKC